MPESKPRKKPAFTPPPMGPAGGPKPTPRWWAPVMVTFMVAGLAWIVTSYVTQLQAPIPAIGPWNIAAGFGLALIGFSMTTRWR